MILNNYRLLKEFLFNFTYESVTSSSSNLTSESNAKTTAGGAVKVMTAGATDPAGGHVESAVKQREIYSEYMRLNKIDGVSFGSSKITPDAADYVLADVISDVAVGTIENTAAAEDSSFRNIVTVSGTNSGAQPITIQSFGLLKNIRYFATSYDYNNIQNQYVLVAEGNLDSAITVPAGGGFVVVIEWDEE